MYRGFNLNLGDKNTFQKYYSYGYSIHNDKKEEIKKRFKEYFIENNKSLSGDVIMDSWFPKGDYHIFLSHSHKDLELALCIAGLLKEKFDLNVFVDSSVWLNSNDLLKIIDDMYCRNGENSTYRYEARNYSTSHVHMMLMNSLNSLINSSEALIFLNTPNSITAKDVIKQETISPWIFSEIETSKIINKVTPQRLLKKTKFFSKSQQDYFSLNESLKSDLQISYELELGHLQKISYNDFDAWINHNYYTPEDALDNLYVQNKLNNIEIDLLIK